MKRVEAYIQPFMLTRVLHELREVHVHGLTVSEVRGFGREKDESYPHHASDYAVDFTPKLKLEILCRDGDVDVLVEALVSGAHTGRRGDGKVFVTDVANAVSIRSRQSGDEAI
ncbi:MAG: transcriptional regulator [Candidatus Eisenbacteria bacterium RBG_16_71_46]|nr:MAG: transcriptional regulator [Candidatus Eisenbacteria bacterium RBG_16_71_46]OGF24311.1 MAG: transcriptional regulator [Candidatus Eisenbacteria bacterium RBG_19FT_COMBO_70_11]